MVQISAAQVYNFNLVGTFQINFKLDVSADLTDNFKLNTLITGSFGKR